MHRNKPPSVIVSLGPYLSTLHPDSVATPVYINRHNEYAPETAAELQPKVSRKGTRKIPKENAIPKAVVVIKRDVATITQP